MGGISYRIDKNNSDIIFLARVSDAALELSGSSFVCCFSTFYKFPFTEKHILIGKKDMEIDFEHDQSIYGYEKFETIGVEDVVMNFANNSDLFVDKLNIFNCQTTESLLEKIEQYVIAINDVELKNDFNICSSCNGLEPRFSKYLGCLMSVCLSEYL